MKPFPWSTCDIFFAPEVQGGMELKFEWKARLVHRSERGSAVSHIARTFARIPHRMPLAQLNQKAVQVHAIAALRRAGYVY